MTSVIVTTVPIFQIVVTDNVSNDATFADTAIGEATEIEEIEVTCDGKLISIKFPDII